MSGQAITSAPRPRLWDHTIAQHGLPPNRQRAPAGRRAPSIAPALLKPVKFVFLFLFSLIYGVLGAAGALAAAVVAILAAPLILFGAVAMIGLILYAVGIVFEALGMA